MQAMREETHIRGGEWSMRRVEPATAMAARTAPHWTARLTRHMSALHPTCCLSMLWFACCCSALIYMEYMCHTMAADNVQLEATQRSIAEGDAAEREEEAQRELSRQQRAG